MKEFYYSERPRGEDRDRREAPRGGTAFGRRCVSAALLVFVLASCVYMLFALRSFSVTDDSVDLRKRSLSEEFDRGVQNLMNSSLDGMLDVKRIYVIPDDTIVAPEPDSAAYGQITDAAALDAVAARAAEYQLIGQGELALTQEELAAASGSEVRYYLDETILALCWKVRQGGDTYNFSEVVIAHPSQFRRYLTDNKFASGTRSTVSQMSRALNSVVGMSGDFYAYRGGGVVVYNGEVCRKNVSTLDNCFIDGNGDMHMCARSTLKSSELADYVANNDISFSLSFGPILVEDGQLSSFADKDYPIGEALDDYSRAALGQLGRLHYLLCTVDGGVTGSDGTNVATLARVMQAKGCVSAYTLDGGQTATMTLNSKIFNRVGYGNERPVSDFIFFATALPEPGSREVSA